MIATPATQAGLREALDALTSKVPGVEPYRTVEGYGPCWCEGWEKGYHEGWHHSLICVRNREDTEAIAEFRAVIEREASDIPPYPGGAHNDQHEERCHEYRIGSCVAHEIEEVAIERTRAIEREASASATALREALLDTATAYHLAMKHDGPGAVCEKPRCLRNRAALAAQPAAGSAEPVIPPFEEESDVADRRLHFDAMDPNR